MATEYFNDAWRIPNNKNQSLVSNYSMDFDGGENVNISPEVDLGINSTVSVWTNFSSSLNFVILGNSLANNYLLYADATNIYVRINDEAETFAHSMVLNQWYNIVLVRTGDSIEVFQNGNSLGVKTGYETTFTTKISTIGSKPSGAFPVVGKIDQTCMFDYALSQDQVTQLGAEGYAFNIQPSQKINTTLTPPIGANNRTFSVWFKTGVTAFKNICGYGNSVGAKKAFDIATHPTGPQVGVHLINSGIEASGVFTPNVWNHYVVTYDGTILRGYLNGQPVNTSTIALDTGTSLDFTIGAGAYTPANGFSGDVSNIAIWDSVLTASNVSTLYNSGKPGDISSLNPEGWWKLNDTATFNSGTSVWSIPDASTNSNTGASVGMNASSLVASNIDGELISNPMSLSPKPIAYYQLGDQTASNDTTEPNPPVQSYLVPNNSLQDYVFQTSPAGSKYFTIPSITIASAATISVWVNIISFSGGIQQAFFGDQNTTKLVVNNQSGFIRVIYSGESGLGLLITTLVTSDFINKWHHIALVQNGGAATVYIDGNSEGNITGTLRTPSFAAIGALASGAGTLNGFVSNAAIFSTDLQPTGTESIASLYNNGTPPDLSSYSNLERWYKLNAQDTFDGTNWTIKDYAGSNDGTSVRMTSANLVQSNLQHTSGFSPYALSLSGGGEFMFTNISALTSISTITTSIWVKLATTNFGYALNINGNNSTEISFGYNSGKFFFYSGAVQGYAANPSSAGVWYNIVLTRSGDTMKMYINGVLEATATGLTTLSLNDYVLIGKRSNGFNIAADVSNLAIWSSELTTSEITTLYNQGLPSNLSTFSTKPIFWSQFGTNSSFNAAANRWTSIDEILGNSVLSHTVMTEDDIVNGVGYSANGLGTSSIEIVGDAPYSTANGISENMDVLDRTTDVPG